MRGWGGVGRSRDAVDHLATAVLMWVAGEQCQDLIEYGLLIATVVLVLLFGTTVLAHISMR